MKDQSIGLVWLLHYQDDCPMGLLIRQMIIKLVKERADWWAGRYNFPEREHYMLALRDYCIDPAIWDIWGTSHIPL